MNAKPAPINAKARMISIERRINLPGSRDKALSIVDNARLQRTLPVRRQKNSGFLHAPWKVGVVVQKIHFGMICSPNQPQRKQRDNAMTPPAGVSIPASAVEPREHIMIIPAVHVMPIPREISMAELETRLAYFKHDGALVETKSIGPGTRIGAFAHVLPGASIGTDCNICDHTYIENNVRIGDRVMLRSGVKVGDGVTLEDDVFVGPNATFTHTPFPGGPLQTGARTVIGAGASIGANASILPGVTVGEKAVIGAGCVVSHNVPPLAVVAGNPARIMGYVGADSLSPGARIPCARGARRVHYQSCRSDAPPLALLSGFARDAQFR